MSSGAIIPVTDSEFDSGGVPYNFKNLSSRFWTEEFADLFNARRAS